MFGGPAPDALAALIAMLALVARRRRQHRHRRARRIPAAGTGAPYPPEQFRTDAGVLDGVALLGDGSVSDMLWARPAVTVLGIDCPPSRSARPPRSCPRAAARLNLRVPPGMAADDAHAALDAHLRAAAPWGVHVDVETEAVGSPFARARPTGRRTGRWPPRCRRRTACR